MTAKADVLAQLVRVVVGEGSDQSLPMRLCHASSVILGADGSAVTLCYTESTRLTVCATDQIAARLEDLQDVLGEGPGPDAYLTGRMVRASLGEQSRRVDEQARRWPAFAAAAQAEVGAAAITAIPIQPGIDVLGVLTLYQLPARPLTKDPTLAQFVADTLGAALLRDGGLKDDMGNGPWSLQAAVHQAAGMVIAQLGVSPEDALALLKAHAFADGTSMKTIAQAVVERRLDFSLEDDSRADHSRADDSRADDS